MMKRIHRLRDLVAVLALLALLPFFFSGIVDDGSLRSISRLLDIGHVVFFALFSRLLLTSTLLRDCSPRKRLSAVLAAVLLLGGTIELVQPFFKRTPEIHDILLDLAGGIAGILFLAPTCTIPSPRRRIARFLAVVLLVAVLTPGIVFLVDEQLARRSFPVLADFEGALEKSRWTGTAEFTIVPDEQVSGNHLLRVVFSTDDYSGVFLTYFPRDWSNFTELAFTIVNPSPEPLSIHFRAHDLPHRERGQDYHDRYNTILTAPPGKRIFHISLDDILTSPRQRVMDGSRMGSLGFFTMELARKRTIYLDDIELLPRNQRSGLTALIRQGRRKNTGIGTNAWPTKKITENMRTFPEQPLRHALPDNTSAAWMFPVVLYRIVPVFQKSGKNDP